MRWPRIVLCNVLTVQNMRDYDLFLSFEQLGASPAVVMAKMDGFCWACDGEGRRGGAAVRGMRCGRGGGGGGMGREGLGKHGTSFFTFRRFT